MAMGIARCFPDVLTVNQSRTWTLRLVLQRKRRKTEQCCISQSDLSQLLGIIRYNATSWMMQYIIKKHSLQTQVLNFVPFNIHLPCLTGADPGFSLGGGGGAQKMMSAHAHYERGPRSPLYGWGHSAAGAYIYI